MQQRMEGEREDGNGKEAAALAIWDCGSPLYDSYELAAVSHLIERHLMCFPSLGGSSRRFIAKFTYSASSSETNSSSCTSNTTKGKGSSSPSLSGIVGIKRMWKRKGFGEKKDKIKKMKTSGVSGFYSKIGLWRKNERM